MKLPIPKIKETKENLNQPVGGTIHQTASPHDAPPPPPPNSPTPPIKDKPVTVKLKSGKLSKIFNTILIIAIVLVLGAVVYLLYQNYTLKQGSSVSENVGPTIVPTSSAPTPDQTASWITYKSEILPLSVRLPVGWELVESENPELGNQKTINFYSPEFEYGETGITRGYQLLIGPYSELTDKYNTFNELSTKENADQKAMEARFQNLQWLKYDTSAKTLHRNIPLNVAIYSNDTDQTQAEFFFNLILPTIKIGE